MAEIDPVAGHSSVRLQEMARPSNVGGVDERRARYIARLRQPLEQLEFVVDGTSLQRLLQDLKVPELETYRFPDPFVLVSIADLVHPGHAAADLRRLAGDLPADDESWPLKPGRFPLYVCPIDHDLGCGAVTVSITYGPAVTTWGDFRLEDGYTDDQTGLNLSALGPFTFPRTAYRDVLLGAAGVVDALEVDDRAAEHQHRQCRTPGGLWRRLRRR